MVARLFENVRSARGRDMSRCLSCQGWTTPEREADHRCPRDLSGQLWAREALRDPYREVFTCPGCGRRTDALGVVLSHLCEGEAAVAAFRADLEEAIERARKEGRAEALLWAYEAAELEADEYGSTWGQGSAGHKALWSVARKMDDEYKKVWRP